MTTHEPMPQERLDAIQERVNDTTRGPWDCYGNGAHEVFDAGEYDDGDPGELVAPVVTKLSDAEFIAHARTDVPALLAEVDRLRALTTVDDDMVERAARSMSAHWHDWHTNEALGRQRALAIAALEAALNPQEGTS